MSVPIIDISYLVKTYSFEPKASEKFLEDVLVLEIAELFWDALAKWGFVYIKECGIAPETIQSWFTCSKEYFDQTLDKKQELRSQKDYVGYIPLKYEISEEGTSPDLDESFNYSPWLSDEALSKLPKKFVGAMDDIGGGCLKLTKLLLRLVNLKLDVEDKNFLENSHKNMWIKGKNYTTIRASYYPPTDEGVQKRSGLHSDFGTMALLFQDQNTGIEMLSPSGHFVQATHIPETIIVYASDLLGRWTSDNIHSTRHQVINIDTPNKAAQLLFYYIQPDNDITVSCLDGSKKYQPVNTLEYLKMEMDKIWPTS